MSKRVNFAELNSFLYDVWREDSRYPLIFSKSRSITKSVVSIWDEVYMLADQLLDDKDN